jgi:uncharacterized membrane protein HdeD (DUF308 family)
MLTGAAMDDRPLNRIQVIWAIVLIVTGLMVFVRTFQVMPDLEQISGVATPGFLRFCFYLLGTLLIVGGVQKLIHQVRRRAGAKGKRKQ